MSLIRTPPPAPPGVPRALPGPAARDGVHGQPHQGDPRAHEGPQGPGAWPYGAAYGYAGAAPGYGGYAGAAPGYARGHPGQAAQPGYAAHLGHALPGLWGAPMYGRPASQMWWLHPVACVMIILLAYSSFVLFDFLRVVPHAYIPGWHYGWGAALLLTMAFGMATATMGRSTAAPPTTGIDVPSWAMAALLVGALFAYTVWFTPVLSNPQLLLEILHGERSNVRDVAPTTPGVTTMTQFGLAYVIAYAAMRASRGRDLEGWETVGLAVIFLLAVVRAVAWSERLAVIELVVCYLIGRLAFVRVYTMRWWRLGTILPLLAPLLVYVAFTGTEYFRSWDYYRNEYDTVWAFSFERLIAYYATASNNGIGLLEENTNWPVYTGRFVAEWLYLMPTVGDYLRESVGDAMTLYMRFLERFARPEFNSPTGIFTVVFDIGYAGSVIYFLAVGAAIGKLWNLWRRQSIAGVLFYPLAVMFLVELLRFNYFSATRCFPVVLALLFLWSVARPSLPTAAQGERSW